MVIHFRTEYINEIY